MCVFERDKLSPDPSSLNCEEQVQDSSTSVCTCVCVNECECVSMAVSVYVRDETVIWSGWERCKAIAFWVINAHTHTR